MWNLPLDLVAQLGIWLCAPGFESRFHRKHRCLFISDYAKWCFLWIFFRKLLWSYYTSETEFIHDYDITKYWYSNRGTFKSLQCSLVQCSLKPNITFLGEKLWPVFHFLRLNGSFFSIFWQFFNITLVILEISMACDLSF